MKKSSFYLLLVIATATSVNLWLQAKNGSPLMVSDLLRLLSQIFAVVGLVWMSVSLLLSAKVGFLEKAMGGLDKIYGLHKDLGSLAVVLILAHPLLLAYQSLPDIAASKIYFVPSGNLAYSLGIVGIYLILLSLVFLVFIRLPYNLWKWSHRLLGAGFLLGGIHSLIIPSDVYNFLPLKLWVGAFILVGAASFVYMLLYYPLFGRKHRYTVELIVRKLDVFDFYLKPQGSPLNFKPGQFAYLIFKNKNSGKEAHPFSISSSPSERLLRVSVKAVGDFTLALADVKQGDLVLLYGPHGGFGESFYNSSSRKLVWVGAGIGITPFLGMLRHELATGGSHEISLYYCCNNWDEAVFDPEIEKLATQHPSLNYCLWLSQDRGRLTLKDISGDLPDPNDTVFQVCGPPKMMQALTSQIVSLGVPQNKIVSENFALL
jgi:predicted ferric reductase